MRRRSVLILWALLSLMSLAGCSPYVRPEQPVRSDWVLLEGENTQGQTFLSENRGLNGMAFYFAPEEPGEGEIVLRLLAVPEGSTEQAIAQIPLSKIDGAGFYRLDFTALADSANRRYFARLAVQGSGAVRMGVGPGDSYLNGARYQNQKAQDSQLEFRLVYAPGEYWLGISNLVFLWLLWLAEGAFVYVLPGWALLSWFWAGWGRLGWGEKLGLAGGFSLALYPLLLLWTDLMGLHLGTLNVWVLPLLGLALLGWKTYRKQKSDRPGSNLTAERGPIESEERLAEEPAAIEERAATAADVAFAIILVLLIASRLWPIRNLAAPLWGDSYQHSMMAQLLLDKGGLFRSWLPYEPYDSLTVQYGFPAAAATFSWLTGLGVRQSVLVAGQLVNVLAVLGLVPLAVRLANGQRWAGVGALLVGGLLVATPALYLNWGRYAQLAGQAILPVALWLLWGVVENGSRRALGVRRPVSGAGLSEESGGETASQRALAVTQSGTVSGRSEESGGETASQRTLAVTQDEALAVTHDPTLAVTPRRAVTGGAIVKMMLAAGVALAGMTLAYYRMPFYYAAFVLVWLPVLGITRWGVRIECWWQAVWKLGASGLIGIVLFAPWLPRLLGSKLAAAVEAGVSGASPLAAVLADYQLWNQLSDFIPLYMLALAALAVLWAAVRRHWLVAALPLWFGILAAYIAGKVIRLPGANMMQNFAVVIAVYIPVALLVSWLVAEAVGWLVRNIDNWGAVLAVVLVSVAAAAGAWNLRHTANPAQYAYVTYPDLSAMAWIQANTPPEANFLVEGTLIYGGVSAVGADGGWWIPLLSERQNSIPPQYTLLNEAPIQAGYSAEVVQLVSSLEENPLPSQAALTELCRFGVTHVYIGQTQGQSGIGVSPLFTTQELGASPAFEALYHQDRVHIYAFDRSGCEALSRQELPAFEAQAAEVVDRANWEGARP
jgi:hypothetical protein